MNPQANPQVNPQVNPLDPENAVLPGASNSTKQGVGPESTGAVHRKGLGLTAAAIDFVAPRRRASGQSGSSTRAQRLWAGSAQGRSRPSGFHFGRRFIDGRNNGFGSARPGLFASIFRQLRHQRRHGSLDREVIMTFLVLGLAAAFRRFRSSFSPWDFSPGMQATAAPNHRRQGARAAACPSN